MILNLETLLGFKGVSGWPNGEWVEVPEEISNRLVRISGLRVWVLLGLDTCIAFVVYIVLD